MPEVLEERETAKTRTRTTVPKPVAEPVDMGPVGPHTIMFPAKVWNDIQHICVDTGTSVSGFLLQCARGRLTRFGKVYREPGSTGEVSVNGASEVKEIDPSLPVSEDAPAEAPAPVSVGEGESPEAPAERRRRRS